MTATTSTLFASCNSRVNPAANEPWQQLPRRPSDNMSGQRNGLLGSIRHTFSKRKPFIGADMNTNDMDNPQKNVAPATRRPNFRANPSTPSDAPPAYTAAPNVAPVPIPTSTSPTAAPEADDAYAFLSTFDTLFLIDDSGSMAGGRWRETRAALSLITPICTTHDADGIDIHFLNHSTPYLNVTSSGAVAEIFSAVAPRGGTPTGQRLNRLLREYLRKYAADSEGTKPINIICITDGEPSDDVESPLISAAKKLDKLDAPAWQVGVQFFQVGRDEQAKRHLKLLDDELAEIAGDEELRDIVDTVPFTGAEGTELTGTGILKVVLGAVTRRLDRKSRELHR